MRDTTKGDKLRELASKENLKIIVLELDVDNEDSAKTAIQQILEQKQRIDVLVNNAGWGLWGCVEDVSVDEFRAQFETNFFFNNKTNSGSYTYNAKARLRNYSKY